MVWLSLILPKEKQDQRAKDRENKREREREIWIKPMMMMEKIHSRLVMVQLSEDYHWNKMMRRNVFTALRPKSNSIIKDYWINRTTSLFRLNQSSKRRIKSNGFEKDRETEEKKKSTRKLTNGLWQTKRWRHRWWRWWWEWWIRLMRLLDRIKL